MREFRFALRCTVPVLCGYVFLGLAFGLLQQQAGSGPLWALGSVCGAALGQVLPFDLAGIDYAMTALFVTILTEQWLTAEDHFPAVFGLGCGVVCLLVLGPDRFLVPALAAPAGGGTPGRQLAARPKALYKTKNAPVCANGGRRARRANGRGCFLAGRAAYPFSFWYAVRGVPSSVRIVPQRAKPFLSSTCCIT